jgi:hypothetical protein
MGTPSSRLVFTTSECGGQDDSDRHGHPQVSNVLYRLHKSVLAARLELFGGMFLLSNGHQNPQDGQDDDHPVHIGDGVAVREDFEALIKHIYGQYVSCF